MGFLTLIFLLLLNLAGCKQIKHIEEKAAKLNSYEATSLGLIKENRELRVVIGQKEFEIRNLQAENQYLKLKVEKTLAYKKNTPTSLIKERGGRVINQMGQGDSDERDGNDEGENEENHSSKNVKGHAPGKVSGIDYVKFKIYLWKPEQLMTMAQSAFVKGNYEKSSQFYNSLIENYGSEAVVTDEIFFQAGLAAYKTQRFHQIAIDHFQNIVLKYPNSKYFRGAKLWMALSFYKMGREKEFFKIVEEFRLKYRNTVEWKILSSHYDEISKQYKK